MKKEFLRIHFEESDPKNYKLSLDELTGIISQAGFRPLTEATPDTLPIGSVVAMYHDRNHTFFFGVVCEYYLDGSFGYIDFSHLASADEEISQMSKKYDFRDRRYRIYMQVTMVGNKPQEIILEEKIKAAGFRSLSEATPEDLPDGAVVFLYSHVSKSLSTVIVRTLSISNKRFLYWVQCPIVVGDWHPYVIMDELNSFKNYSYLVVS